VRRAVGMKKYISVTVIVMFLAAVSGMPADSFAKEQEEALVKTFNYDYSTCYWKMDDLLKAMPHVSVYSERYDMILLHYINPNTTQVGVYFTAVDATHTKVEVVSESSSAKNWIAGNLFSETVKKQEESIVGNYKGSSSKTKDW
jgi:hypothetical protein